LVLRRLAVLLLAVTFPAASAFAYRASAWIAPWDTNSLTTLQTNAGNLSESNPVWYSLSSSGAIVANWNAENSTWRAAMTGTELLPTVQNLVSGSFNVTVTNSLIGTAASRDSHAEAIRQLVVNKGYDGIDIDYEALPSASRANFTAFIETLASKLHASGKKLSVTVHPKTNDSASWDGPASQDWPRLGAVADSIKIMAYDYHWSTSAAGALTPLDWLDGICAYALSAIPSTKVTIGLPWYGYDWRGTAGVGVTYTQAMATAQANGAAISRDPNGELTYAYADHIVYFQDATSYTTKVNRVRTKYPQIDSFAHWRLGQEDPDTWAAVKSYLDGSSFSDVPPTHPFYSFVEAISRNGITSGCGDGKYCPDTSITRGQMSVFLLRAKHGAAYQPPAATGKVYSDVPVTYAFAPWVEELSREGAATTCGTNQYCPSSAMTRSHMATMLLKMRDGASYAAPTATGRFTDVAISSPFAPFIEELARRAITSGCSATQYCPDRAVTRGQMAVFVSRTFGLQ
jgi:spore germination protein YaaH